MPKVSVVIPVYNVEKYLRECLDSVINQTLKDIEIICVNDGSTDDSGSICDEYAQNDSRVKVIHQKNQYVGIARNNGMSAATGDFVICLDSDDTFDVNMLETMYNKAVEADADITICHEEYYNTKKNDMGKTKWTSYCLGSYENNKIFSAKDMPDYILNFCVLWPWDKLYKRKFLVDKNLKYLKNRIVEASEDLIFVGETLLLADKILVLPNEFIVHKYHSLSLEANRNIYSSSIALKTLYSSMIKNKIYKDYEKSFINLALRYYLFDLSVCRKENKKKLLKEIKKGFKYFKINNYNEDYFYSKYEYIQYKKLTNIFYNIILKIKLLAIILCD